MKAASWGDEKRTVEDAINQANRDIETRQREITQEKEIVEILILFSSTKFTFIFFQLNIVF